MNKNDIVTVEITDIGVSGEGIGHVDGYTLFIKDAVIGDVVEAKVMKAKKNYGYARLMKVITPSEYRVEPKCAFARRCGGCQIQEMSYDRQLVFKDQKIRGNLERIGGFTKDQIDTVMQPVVGMEPPFGYRNKAQFPFGTDKEGNPITGFYAGRTHDIIANTDCALGVEQNKEILEIILQYMRENKIKSYDEKTGKGLIRHALIRYGFKTKEIMVCLVVNGKKLPKAERLIEKLIQIEGMTSITISPNTRRDNVIMGDSYEILWGQGYITDYIGNVKYQISPLSFYQVNPVQTEKLYGLALEYADLKGDETVWDLYCGIGTISLFLAQKAKQVYGVEIVPQAIDDAKENAKINAIDNPEILKVIVAAGADGSFRLDEEATDNVWCSTTFTYKWGDEAVLTITPEKTKKEGMPAERAYELVFTGTAQGMTAQKKKADGTYETLETSYDSDKQCTTVILPMQDIESEITVVTYNTALADNHQVERIFELLNRAEIEFSLKEKIYAIAQKKGSRNDAYLLDQLTLLNAPEDVFGAVKEILTALD